MMDDIIIENLSISFPLAQGEVVHSVSVRFRHNKITAVVGESGSGKSLLGKSIVNLIPEAKISGTIKVGVQKLDGAYKDKLRGKGIFYIPQNPLTALNPTLTVRDQFLDLLYFNEQDVSNVSEIHNVLKEYGLEDCQSILNSYPFQLSGGMQQRVICAMANLLHPKWIIADEPTKGLDAIARKQVVNIFRKLQENIGCGIIVITHDLQVAEVLSHYLVVMESGLIRECGVTYKCILSPKSKYLNQLLSKSLYRKTLLNRGEGK